MASSSEFGYLANMLHTFHTGQKATLVLLHGFVGDAMMWRRVVDWLPQKIYIVALGIPGHYPGSIMPSSFVETCDYLADELSAIKNGPIYLAGYSLGARLALGIVARHPSLVRSVIFISGHIGLKNDADKKARLLSDAQWIALLEKKGMPAFLAAWESQPIFRAQRFLPEAVELHERRLLHDPHKLAASLRATGLGQMPNYRSALACLAAKAFFVVGGEDAKFLQIAREAQAMTPGASLQVIAGCGHNPLLEAPRELATYIGESLKVAARGA